MIIVLLLYIAETKLFPLSYYGSLITWLR